MADATLQINHLKSLQQTYSSMTNTNPNLIFHAMHCENRWFGEEFQYTSSAIPGGIEDPLQDPHYFRRVSWLPPHAGLAFLISNTDLWYKYIDRNTRPASAEFTCAYKFLLGVWQGIQNNPFPKDLWRIRFGAMASNFNKTDGWMSTSDNEQTIFLHLNSDFMYREPNEPENTNTYFDTVYVLLRLLTPWLRPALSMPPFDMEQRKLFIQHTPAQEANPQFGQSGYIDYNTGTAGSAYTDKTNRFGALKELAEKFWKRGILRNMVQERWVTHSDLRNPAPLAEAPLTFFPDGAFGTSTLDEIQAIQLREGWARGHLANPRSNSTSNRQGPFPIESSRNTTLIYVSMPEINSTNINRTPNQFSDILVKGLKTEHMWSPINDSPKLNFIDIKNPALVSPGSLNVRFTIDLLTEAGEPYPFALGSSTNLNVTFHVYTK
nr:hypothetical protein BaRGS_000629 [Batillaria attramentaria]